MKIKKTQLEVIIREEIDAFLLEVSRHDKPESVRKRELPWEVFPGYDDRNGGLKQLQNGIMEEEDLEEDCPGQRYHDRQGRWTDPKDDSGSWSIEGADCDKTGQRKRAAPSKYSTSISPSKLGCGRKGRFRCKDQTAKWGPGAVPPTNEVLITDDEEPGLSGADRAYMVGLIQQTVKQMQSEKGQAQTGCSIEYCLKVLNAMSRAGTGKLNDPPKPAA